MSDALFLWLIMAIVIFAFLAVKHVRRLTMKETFRRILIPGKIRKRVDAERRKED